MSSFTVSMACVAAFMSLPVPLDVPGEMADPTVNDSVCYRYPGAADPERPFVDGEPWDCPVVFTTPTRMQDMLTYEVVTYMSWPPRRLHRAFAAAWYVRYWNERSMNFPLMWEAAKECEFDTPVATEKWGPHLLPPTPLEKEIGDRIAEQWKKRDGVGVAP